VSGGPAELGPGQRYRFQVGVHAELASDVVQVRINGLQRHTQLPGHLTLPGAFCEVRAWQSQSAGESSGLEPTVRTELTENVLDLGPQGLRRDVHLAGIFLVL
jgi:hypothetical protein